MIEQQSGKCGCGLYNDSEWYLFYRDRVSNLKNCDMKKHLESCALCQDYYATSKKRYQDHISGATK